MGEPTTFLELRRIRTDGGTQMRERTRQEIVDEYAAMMDGGAVFPPARVFLDAAGSYWLASGFHRRAAREKLGHKVMEVIVMNGESRDAILYACGANTNHGLQRSNEDKQKAVTTLLRDGEWGRWSDAEIGRRCGVTDRMVARWRAVLSPNASGTPRTCERGGTTFEMTPPNQRHFRDMSPAEQLADITEATRDAGAVEMPEPRAEPDPKRAILERHGRTLEAMREECALARISQKCSYLYHISHAIACLARDPGFGMECT